MTARRTKIVATLGPATSSRERIAELIDAGMDVARMNFSHGSYEAHAERIVTQLKRRRLRYRAHQHQETALRRYLDDRA